MNARMTSRPHLRAAAAFVALAFALSWAAWLPLLATGAVIERGSGWPTHFFGLLGPALAALVVAGLAGRAVLADLGRRLWPARSSLAGWALALSPAAVIVAFVIAGADPEGLTKYSGLPVLPLAGLFLLVLAVNGLGEELGWRGFLLPRLQSVWGPVAGALATGAIWALWHLPLFFVVASYLALPGWVIVAGFLPGLMAGSLVLAHVTARAGVLGAALWHALYNMAVATLLAAATKPVVAGLALVWAVALVATAAGRRALAVPPPPDGSGRTSAAFARNDPA